MSKIKIYSMISVVLFIFTGIANAQSVLFSKLTSENEALRKESMNTIIATYSKAEEESVSKEIFSCLQKDTTLSIRVKRDLIQMLGRLKRTESIPWLINNINFTTISYSTSKNGIIWGTFKNPMTAPRYTYYPAEDALVDIGTTSRPYLISKLKTSSDKHIKGAYERVLYRLEKK